MSAERSSKIIKQRIAALRKEIIKHDWYGYFIPSTDPHQDEWLPERWKRREFISGFTGSYGDLLVTLDGAWLWTDSRYFIEADIELYDTSIISCKLNTQGAVTLEEILKANFSDRTLGVDPSTLFSRERERFLKILDPIGGKLALSDDNLVDRIWVDRPSFPNSFISFQNLNYSGISISEKLQLLREDLAELIPKEAKRYVHPVTDLNAIAWLFNLRGNDTPYNPVAISFAIITEDTATLFLDSTNISQDLNNELISEKIQIRPYTQLFKSLGDYFGNWIIDRATTNIAIIEKIKGIVAQYSNDSSSTLKDSYIHYNPSPITILRAIKNPVEQDGFRNAHLRDGVAVSELLHWLETVELDGSVSEFTISEKLEQYRNKQPLFRGPSFPSIVGYGSNGAIVHYSPKKEAAFPVGRDSLILIDSGGHYLDGTTDVTRTIHLGNPTQSEKIHYTLVLKGHLALARVAFPVGTDGCDLDVLARAPLWSQGLNYGHGTGHGVGCYLSVHDGPQKIAVGRRSVPLSEGMVISNEPGFYEAGKYGIRIENLELVVEHTECQASQYGAFLSFETLTLVPYCRKLIDTNLLSDEEISQINSYHKKVLTKLAPLAPPSTLLWLKSACSPLV